MPRLKGEPIAWTDDRVELLKELWAAGMTAGQIADRMPFSRSAICSAARRYRLEPRPKVCIPRPKSVGERLERMIGDIADENTPLRVAAEKAKVTVRDARTCFDGLIARYDMGNAPCAADDLIRGPERPASEWAPLP